MTIIIINAGVSGVYTVALIQSIYGFNTILNNDNLVVSFAM